MKVAGFTFIKNALIYDYPIQEAILSIADICDKIYVAVGKSDDDTLALIQKTLPAKIEIIQTEWDETQRQGGRVLALETDKAFAAIPSEYDWAFYIQGDEVLHEKYLPTIKLQMQLHKDSPNVDGLLFHYHHFYASYDYIATSPNWYQHEIRVVKNNKKIYSYQDAQGFRKNENEKLKVVPIEAYMHHYGWVKEPKAMQKKQENFNKYWHDDNWIEKHVEKNEAFDYEKNVQSLTRFQDTHPQVMHTRIENKNWKFDYDPSFQNIKMKHKIKQFLKTYLGLDFSYRNYTIVRR